jgi:stage V sporulation protein G
LSQHQAVKDDDGRVKLYADIAHPINAVCREMIQERVIQAFTEEKNQSELPGYTPIYDDFEQEAPTTPAAPTPAEPPPVESIQVQGAESPRGPHKVPSQQPQPEKSINGGFGAGVFE